MAKRDERGQFIKRNDAGGDGRDPGGPDIDPVDPDTAVDGTPAGGSPIDVSGDEPRRGPGRPRGTGNKSRPGAAPLSPSVDGITASLLSVHAMLAAMTKVPELELTDDEAKALAKGIIEVNKHYPIPNMTPGYVAIGALASTAFMIYKKRVPALMKRKPPVQAAPVAPGTHVPANVPPAPVAPWVDFTSVRPQ